MNIKSLLLGSAAALVAVSGARAADAVVIAEPEPMEYVRVCDVYGTGFFYIPGTETCLRVGGYIRYDIGIGALGHQDVLDKKDLSDGVIDTNDTYYKRARFQLRVDSRSETELGTLRTYAAINFQYTTASNAADVDGDGFIDGGITDAGFATEFEHAYIELGGFRVGKTDSLFSTFTGYAGGVINDDIVSYGPFGTHQIAYTFTGGNGFSAAVALEVGDGDEGFLSNDYTLDSYVPHVVAGVAWTQGWGGISAVAGYDSVWEEWAGKVRLDVNATEQLALFIMAGYASGADDDFLGVPDLDSPNYYGSWGGDWAVWGGGTYTVSEQTKINVQLSYDEQENFAAVANVNYELVPGLVITPEIVYVDNFDDDIDDDSDEIGGFLRFQRTF
ncbi:porin [Allomesorhizobium alhagi]|uniref:Porin n=1 Tax=Mesorhizobium alhagi CCNWXJ12-2 TaxID=1107882 RepID=H0I283_9HYPH|nr:porin [Mesorhizobium alhagi]EHK52969.1 porin [Mesorhizobium alhagi CCNWXJ12-2]